MIFEKNTRIELKQNWFVIDDASIKDGLNAFFDYDRASSEDKTGSGIHPVCEGENEELNDYGECVEIQTFPNINDLIAQFQ